jgi:hypothetical protein
MLLFIKSNIKMIKKMMNHSIFKMMKLIFFFFDNFFFIKNNDILYHRLMNESMNE